VLAHKNVILRNFGFIANLYEDSLIFSLLVRGREIMLVQVAMNNAQTMKFSHNGLARRKVRDGSVSTLHMFDDESDDPVIFCQIT